MTTLSTDQGTIQTLLNRLANMHLPRALELKDKVDRGETLDNHELDFLQRVLEDARSTQNIIERHPELHELATKLVSLYSEITRKALQNEQKIN
ncbi:MAG: hypothetical protein K0Q67_2097 [Cellvibrio sp.]|nr:hypothetical protein [Cellvibrio sp.]